MLGACVAVHAPVCASPFPRFGGTTELRPHGVALDVFQNGEQMRICLDEERFVGALVQVAMPDRVLARMVPAHVRGREPMERETQIAIVLGMEQKMPMVGHDDVREYAHVERFAHLIEQVLKVAILGIEIKHLRAVVGAIDDVIHIVAHVDPWTPSHEPDYDTSFIFLRCLAPCPQRFFSPRSLSHPSSAPRLRRDAGAAAGPAAHMSVGNELHEEGVYVRMASSRRPKGVRAATPKVRPMTRRPERHARTHAALLFN